MTGVVLVGWSLVGLAVVGWFCAWINVGKVEQLEADLAELQLDHRATLDALEDTEAALVEACRQRDRLRDGVRVQVAENAVMGAALVRQVRGDDCPAHGLPSVADRAAGIEVAS